MISSHSLASRRMKTGMAPNINKLSHQPKTRVSQFASRSLRSRRRAQKRIKMERQLTLKASLVINM